MKLFIATLTLVLVLTSNANASITVKTSKYFIRIPKLAELTIQQLRGLDLIMKKLYEATDEELNIIISLYNLDKIKENYEGEFGYCTSTSEKEQNHNQ